MKAIILAADIGRRMMPLTAEKHKCLPFVAGCAVLNRIIDPLLENGITDLMTTRVPRAQAKASLLHPFYNAFDELAR
jgi:choline kinase